MNKISSFTIDHDYLVPGLYLSSHSKCNHATTYDLRVKTPNNDDYMSTGEMHTFEHLFATFVRNYSFSQYIIYFGPMGCRTGFYLVVNDIINEYHLSMMVKDALEYIINYEGEIPGAASSKECGNWKDHDLEGAKKLATDYYKVLTSNGDVNYVKTYEKLIP